jgi:mono/diheme cytochrome c family protein
LADILGADFRANAVEVVGERNSVAVEGFAGLPTLTRANALGQYLFVNGRPVRDKLLLGVVRGAYADYLPRDRHPIVALFVTLPAREVDVNVHPAKAEVRFRDPGLIRALLITSLQQALTREGQRAASTGGSATIAAFRSPTLPSPASGGGLGRGHTGALRLRRASAALAACAMLLSSPLARAADPTEAEVDQGREIYADFCAACHGRDMVNPGGVTVDLRKFPKDAFERFRNAVLDGKPPAMPAWRDKVGDDDVKLLWAYVRSGG